MSTRTVIVVSDDGRLVNADGVIKESDSHYRKFADRLVGELNSQAVINYGWNGKDRLVIAAGENLEAGERITLKAREVVVPNTLTIGDTTLQQLLSQSEVTTLNGIRGTANQIDVLVVDNPDAGAGGQPDRICVLSISQALLDRLSVLEAKVDAIIRFDDIYFVGDGLKVDRATRDLSVRLGTGLKFEDATHSSDSSDSSGDEETRAVAVDMEEVAEILHLSGYNVDIDPDTENMALYRRLY